MVTGDPQQRKHSSLPFLSRHDGAPPTPPPGGYQHARRFPSTPYALSALSRAMPAEAPAKKTERRHPLGWISLTAACVFAGVLLVALLMGATDAIYGTTMLALQLLVALVVIAAVIIAPSRALGAWALAIVLVLNVGTMGAAGALATSATGSYGGGSSSQEPGSAYPGIKDFDDALVQSAPSLEETAGRMDEVSEAIRKRLSDEYGYHWVKVSDSLQRYSRNGYGGESMLQEYTAPVWATEEPIHDYSEKVAVMATINDVLAEEGVYYSLYPLNEPYDGITDDSIDKLYGGTDPETQVRWSYYTQLDDPSYETGAPEPSLFWAEIIDLTHDDTGRWRKQQEAQAADGVPLEGMQLIFRATQKLSEDDRDAYAKALKEHPKPSGDG